MPSDLLLDRFQNPTPAERGRVLWVWNGSLDRAHLLRQLRHFQAQGVSGAIIRAGAGLRTAYLDKDWFELVNLCADEAARLGLKLWLADEERGPSGSAGGRLTTELTHARRILRLKISGTKIEWPRSSAFVKAYVARVDGLEVRDCEPLAYQATPPEDGRSVLIFSTEVCGPENIHNGHPPLDLLSREATGEFIKTTHERYRSRCLTRLGTVIDGFFTDTPSPGTIMSASGRAPNAEWTVPWTAGLWTEFQSAWGYDLREHLPELFLFPEGRRLSRVKLNFASTIQRLLENNWLRPLREWCEGCRVSLVGRLPGGDSLAAQSAACPSVMRVVEFLDVPVIPGADFPTLKHVASAARQVGGRRVLDLTPPGADAATIESLALRGVTAAFPGAEPASRGGIAKRVYAERLDRTLADASARLHLLLGAGERVCDVAIINPIETAWAQMHPGWASSEEVSALEKTVTEIAAWLNEAQIDFDFLDEGMLSRTASVLNGRLGFGRASYRVVVVVGAVTLRSTTLELLRQMTVTGGTVVFMGDPPTHIDLRPSSAALALAVDATRIGINRSDLLRAAAPDAPSVGFESGTDQSDLFCQVRRTGDRWIVALQNTSTTARQEGVSVLFESGGVIEEWRSDTGDTVPIETEGGRWLMALDPQELRILVASAAESPARSHAATQQGVKNDGLSLHLFESAEWQLPREPWQPACDLIALDVLLREGAQRPTRESVQIQPWAREESFGSTMRVKRLSLRFRFRLEGIPSDPFDLVIESPGSWRLTLNGSAIRIPINTEWHGDPSQRRVPLPIDFLRHGINEVVALVPFIDETDLEPVGLLGRFTATPGEDGPILRPR
jgi:hypothetical protein